MNELVDLSDLSNLREQALEAFRSQEKMSLNEALEQGAVTCRRRACKRRHDNTISGVLGLGFCSSQCASRENEKQQKLLDTGPSSSTSFLGLQDSFQDHTHVSQAYI